ncbi:unnamed protein product [Kuraishia capsulata CBS 1993]|uniref:Protein SQS1 n=1 Tax=Kuraishia capsulata CBS 1993 TaxID=1382522 RepID=W6MPA0_9ASCO|nr:uncharacterized protein KUCA_T00004094001 [Kuraishia capsulata CBS 1993]CDK28113.1 unnamed protein product [Kuraishia capsulata CBS 1993]
MGRHRGGARSGSRGGARGGARGRGRGRGRGGSSRGGFARSRGNYGGQYPELMDFDDNIFIPGGGRVDPRSFERKHMGLGSELVYTQDHEELSMRGPIRKRPPITFVLAKEVYDPSKLVKEFVSMKIHQVAKTDENIEDFTDISKDLDAVLYDSESESEESLYEEEEEEADESEKGFESDPGDLGDSGVDMVVGSGGEGFEEVATVEDSSNTNLASLDSLDSNHTSDSDSASETIPFEIDTQGDPDHSQNRKPVSEMKLPSNEPPKLMNIPTPVVVKRERDTEKRSIRVGGVDFSLQTDLGETYIELPAKSKASFRFAKEPKAIEFLDEDEDFDEDVDDDIDDEFHYYKENIPQDQDMDSASETDSEPAYGLLPEDFIDFDLTSVKVENIRESPVGNRYFVQSGPLFGDLDFRWVDHWDLSDLLIEKGFNETRFGAFIKHLTKELTQSDPEPEYDYPFSDTSEDDESEDDEGLQDLVNFNFNRAVHHELDSNEPLKTRGKGKKKRLDTSMLDLDPSMIQSLEASFEARNRSKIGKKKNKKSTSMYDLSILYPTAITIEEILEEIDLFFNDDERQTLEFPPFNNHAQKMITWIANEYHLKTRIFGQGLSKYAVLIKKAKTYNSEPDYDAARSYLQKRVTFFRSELVSKGSRNGTSTSTKNKSSKLRLQEGEVVGDGAPAIGQENIGRRLLEKLGWTQGSGLGVENMGISEPILAKMKNSKSGLR